MAHIAEIKFAQFVFNYVIINKKDIHLFEDTDHVNVYSEQARGRPTLSVQARDDRIVDFYYLILSSF